MVAVNARSCLEAASSTSWSRFGGERRVEPRLEDRGLIGFDEVVGRPELDASDDAVQLLDAGHDDDADVARRLLGLHGGQGLVAIELRHEHVEQHDVDFAGQSPEQIRARAPFRPQRTRAPARRAASPGRAD